jgi:Mycotoxin biosynthesis protein UstYa
VCLSSPLPFLNSNLIFRLVLDAAGYIGDDYPMRLPLLVNTVQTTFDCSARYVLNSSQSHEVWSKSADSVTGGFVRLGDDYRTFAVSMYHQLDCMAIFHSMLIRFTQSPGGSAHMHHCLNYLRQSILCSADDTQEPPLKVAELKNRGCALPFTRQCRDWTALYSFSSTNYLNFHEFKARNGSWPREL